MPEASTSRWPSSSAKNQIDPFAPDALLVTLLATLETFGRNIELSLRNESGSLPSLHLGRFVFSMARAHHSEGLFHVAMSSIDETLPAMAASVAPAKEEPTRSRFELAPWRSPAGKRPNTAIMPPAATVRASATSTSEKPPRALLPGMRLQNISSCPICW